MNREIILTFNLFLISVNVLSQTTDEFSPGGKPFMRIFSNFHTTASAGESFSAFELTRIYLGYQYDFSKQLTALANIDFADPGTGGLEMTAFIKNAYLNYHTERLSVFFGMIPTTQFKIQEDFWGKRYIEKSFQDAYGFNASADLGISLSYRLSDFLSADIIVANGEGYKKLAADSVLRTGFGMTMKPSERLTGRVYYDFSPKGATLSSLAFFAGYTCDQFKLAAEYNKQYNKGFLEDHDLYGPSFYGAVRLSGKLNVFGRYDKLMSGKVAESEADWNLSNDGELYLVGLEYQLMKGIRLSPNFRGWNPAQSSSSFSSSFFLSCEIKI